MWRISILTFLVFFSGYSQVRVQGEVIDNQQRKLEGASILIREASEDKILTYDITDKNGYFLLSFSSSLDSIVLEVNHLGYTSYSELMGVDNEFKVIKLIESSENLKEVHIESGIGEKKGDTLRYVVSAFKGGNDRVIADVIRKLPGLEIKGSGQIFFQGKPIEKYYIEGLDLLEGRYNLANNNINVEDVSRVEVLQNHQPIKLLDSLEFSENASLNIKLKKDVTISGKAEIGVGVKPFLWKGNLTPMLFLKDQQGIVSLQSNNIGIPLIKELNTFSISEDNNLKPSIDENKVLRIQEVGNPDFSSKRWLNNESNLGSLNYLYRLDDDRTLKSSVSYLHEGVEESGVSFTTIYTPTDSINYKQIIFGNSTDQSFETRFIFENNSKSEFLKNDLEISLNRTRGYNSIDRGNTQVEENLSTPLVSFQNRFRTYFSFGKHLIKVESDIHYSQLDQQLIVSPNLMSDFIPSEGSLQSISQNLAKNKFSSENSVGFTKGIKDISISSKLGFSINEDHLESQIYLNSSSLENNNFKNDYGYRRNHLFFSSSLRYRKDALSMRLTIPIRKAFFELHDNILDKNTIINPWIFEPGFFIKREFSAYWEGSLNLDWNKYFGSINQLYPNYILNTYRTLQKYDLDFPESTLQNYGLRLSYKDPVKSLFSSLKYRFAIKSSNLLYGDKINSEGLLEITALKERNYWYTQNIELRWGKYLSKYKTNINGGIEFSKIKGERLINNQRVDIINRTIAFDFAANLDMTNWLTVDFNTKVSWLNSQSNNISTNQIKNGHYFMDIYLYTGKEHFFHLNTEYYKSIFQRNKNNNIFLNLGYNYIFEKSGIELSANLNNILNTKQYNSVRASDYSILRTEYDLRPFQILFSCNFTL